MAIQKHNIYYDASKPESGIYYYAENGEQKELFLNNILSGENGISAISAVDGNTWVIGITDDYKDNIEKIPGLSDNFVILSADVGNKLYVSATDNWDVLPYSGSTNISIHDHIIDFQNTANLIGDDTHIAVISADNNIIVSALKDFVDEEYVDEAIASSVSGKFDSSAFNTYSGIIDNKIDKLSNDLNNKLDISATNNWDISAYSAGNHISIADHIISIEDAKNLSGDEKNIIVLETADAFVISGLKDFVDKEYVDEAIASAAPTSAVANKLDKAVFSAYSADIALQLNNISADKLDTSAFTAYSAHALDDYYKTSETSGKQEIQNALDEKQDNLTNEQLSAISSVSAIQSISANWLTEEDIEDFITEDEVESVSSTLTAQTNYLSGIIDTKLDKTEFDTYTATALDDYYTKDETKGLINDLSGTVSSQLNNKLDTSTFAAYSGNINNQINTVSSEIDKKLYTSATNDWDITPYSGINGIKVENHLISVSANYALSADVYSKSQIDDIIANFGGFQIVNEDAQGKPDVSDPSTKIIYLTLVDDDPAAFDKYREWIWTNSEWECIGIASIDLKDYAKTQDVIASADATSAWINNTFYNKTETSGKTEIQNALDTKLDTTAFNDYSDNIDDQLQALSSIKLDTSAFTAYSADIDSQLDTLSAIKLDKTYSATVNEQLTAKLDTSAFTAYSAEINTELNNITTDVDKKLYTSATDNWDYIAYSGGQNVSIVDHIIDISGTKSLSGDGKNIEVVELADTFIISATKDIVDKSYVDNNFVSKTDFGTYSGNTKNQINSKLDISAFTAYSATALDDYYKKSDTSGKTEIQNALGTKLDTTAFNNYSANVKTQIDSKLTKNDFDSYSAAVDNDIDYISATVSSIPAQVQSDWEETNTSSPAYIQNKPVDLELSAGNGISITETNNTLVFAVSGNYADATEVDTDINYLSGIIDTKLDTTAFNGYSANIKTQIDSKLTKNDFDSYSAIIDTNIDYISAAVSSIPAQVQSDWEETDTTSPAYIQNKPVDLEMSAGDGISITETNNTLVFAVSGNYADATEVNNKLTALSANKLDISATTGWDISAYSAGNNITIVDHVIDLKESKNLIGDGENIIVTESGNNIIVSALKDILDKDDFDSYSAIIDDDIDYLSAAIEDSILSVGTDLKIENGIISVNTNGIVENSADMSFVAGSATYASGIGAAAFGYATSAVNDYAFAEGSATSATGIASHAEGFATSAIGSASYAGGCKTLASGDYSHAEGSATLASGKYSHAEGGKTSAIGTYTHAEGADTKAAGEESHAEGWGTVASGHNSHAEGNYTTAAGVNSHAEGYKTSATNYAAHAEGYKTSAMGQYTHTEGQNTIANNDCAHAEGQNTSALKMMTHAEGQYTIADKNCAHAEGFYTKSSGEASHTEGQFTSATMDASHAEGGWTIANANYAHAEGHRTSAIGYASHAEGDFTIAGTYNMHAGGMYNKTSADALYVIGNGSAETARSDAFIITSAGLASATILATSGIPDVEAAITSIPAQVQTDWEETNTASPAYIQNKPVDLEMSAGNGISITEVNDTLVFAVSGNYADATEVDTYYGKKTNDVYYIKPDLPYDLYSSTATYNVGDKVVLTAGSGSLYSAKSAVTTPGAWSTNSGKFAGVSNVVFTAENEDITELYDGLKIALYLPSRLASADSYLNINGLGDVELYKNNNIKLTSGYFPTSGVVIYFTYVSATNRWVWADYDSNSTYAGMVDAYVNLSASATNISAACTNFSAKPGNTINVSFARDYTAVSAKKFRAGTTTYQPLYLNGSATSNTNYFIPSGTWPVYYDGDNWYLWTDGSIQFSAIRGTVIDCVKYNDIQYAIGTANTAIGSTTARYSVALGISNSAYNSFVIGNYNKGNESHIFGNSNSGINSYIVGYNCTGNESYLFGKDLSGKSWGIELGDFGDTCYPVIVGNKNATHTSAYFVVGCGNTLGNADAFIVSSNKVASAADFLAGNGVSLSSLTGLATSSWVNGQIADAITSIPAQVQSDWSATNTASPAYILNKPNQIDMQCGTYLDITSANNQITLDADISAISAALSDYANIQSDWSATNTASPAYIQNKPDVLIPVDSPAALGGISKPINIMVVSAMPASPDSATIYLVQGTMIGN